MQNPHQHQHRKRQLHNLSEGLRAKDLDQMVSSKITIDQYKSKMGKDANIIVVAFRVEDKFPAIDLMEFIEKGYNFVLDADMSSGEEATGDYAVFVELERTDKAPKQIVDLLRGAGQLCNIDKWKFRFFKDVESHDATEEEMAVYIPLTPEDYETRVKQQSIKEVSDVLNQGATTVVDIDTDSNVTIEKPFAGTLKLQVESIGSYDDLKNQLKGAIQLDESSRSQVAYLEKYLGNYEIHKIDNRFLIKNGQQALIINKDRW